MIVKDPTLFLYAFFDRHLPGHVKHDPRELFRSLHADLDGLYGLDTGEPAYRADDIAKLNLAAVAMAQDGFVPWIGRTRTGPGTELRQALGYSFGDVLFLHTVDSRGGTSGDFAIEWKNLTAGPAAILLGADRATAPKGLWGLNICYSVLVPDADYERLTPPDVELLVQGISPEPPVLADARMGQLCLVGSNWLGLKVPSELLATWVLISPESAEKDVQSALHAIGGSAAQPHPPTFPLLLEARQKFYVQLGAYQRDRESLRLTEDSLGKRMRWMRDAHRDFDDLGSTMDSDEAEELRLKASRAHTDLAAFEQAVARVNDAENTLRINVRNQRETWARLRGRGDDRIFDPEHDYMDRRIRQVAYDASYFARTIQGAQATLAAAQARFNISSERGQALQVRYGVVQVSGLIASLLALVVTEVLGLSAFAPEHPVLTANLILLTLVGSFAVTQLMLAWGRLRTSLTRVAVAAAAGLVATTLLAIPRGQPWELWFGPVAFVVVALAVYARVRYMEERPRLEREPAWRVRAGYTSGVEKLRLANQELADLLDDLPPTGYYRLKGEASLLGKIERKNEERAREQGISVQELVARGEVYTERDIGDAIGIRYVTSPWELPVFVRRVERVLGPKLLGIDYKTGRYKSAHLDLDLWGIGAKDINLLAEVQVRTRLQDFYANAVHDVIYKDVPGGGLAFLRWLKRWPGSRWTLPFWDRLLALPSDIELRLFRKWMRWYPRPTDAGSPESLSTRSDPS